MKKIAVIIFMITILISCGDNQSNISNLDLVNYIDKKSHYEVVLNFKESISSYEMGAEYGKKILEMVPDYCEITDSYLANVCYNNTSYYNMFLNIVQNFKSQIPSDYIEEIEGLSSVLCEDTENIINNQKLSKDEFYFINLLPDVARQTQCSALSIYDTYSEISKTMTARMLDWYAGNYSQLTKIQAVITIKKPSTSICSIGYLGFVGIITGFNKNKVFASILDSGTGLSYNQFNKNSYPLDLRYALENKTTLNEVADYMSDINRNYSYNHNIFLSDPVTSKVLENNFSGTGTDMKRTLRSDTSILNDSVSWGFKNAVAAVNSFILKGNHDNHTGEAFNINRWASIKTELFKKGNIITKEELKEIITFDNYDGPDKSEDGDIYNNFSQQIIIFIPETLSLEVFFRKYNSSLPDEPEFEKIKVDF